MKESSCFVILMLIISFMAFNASAITDARSENLMTFAPDEIGQRQINDPAPTNAEVTLTLYILERNGNGTPLSGVAIAAYDAAGNSFQGITGSDGFVVMSGQPGLWQFIIAKEGYRTLSLAFNVTETSAAIAPIDRIDQQQEAVAETSAETVALTVYVHDSDLNGSLLGGVQVNGQDAAGSSFSGNTGSSGAVIIEGMPGTWQFTFSKEGYDTLNLNYDVTETGEGDVYLQEAAAVSQEPVPAQEIEQKQVALTIHIHEGDLNGTMLSDVQVAGRDAAGDLFGGITDSNGIAVVRGQPGLWQFTFSKEGYETLNLSYNVTETEDTAAYLLRSAEPQEQLALLQPAQ